MAMTRRDLLASGGAVGALALAGCTGRCGPSLPFLGPSMPQDGAVGVEPVESAPEDATVLQFSELPDSERALLRTAVESGGVAVCLDGGGRAEALRSFTDRVEFESYLRYEGRLYGLAVRVTDQVLTGTGSLPDTEGNPCC